MKVTEIITESQILNEQIGTFLKFLGIALEQGSIRGVERALLWISKSLAGKSASTAAAELGEAWAQTAIKMGTSVEEAILLGEKQAVAGGLDRAVIEAAKKQAAKVFAQESGQATGLLAKVGKDTDIVKAWLGTKYQLLDGVLLAYGIAEPIITCVLEINKEYARWDSKKDPEYLANPNLLQGDVQHHIDVCIRQIMALWAGRGISKFVFGANGIQRLPFLGGDRMAAIFNTMGAVSKTAFTAWLDSPPGRKAFAEWVLGDTLAAAGFKYVTDFISGMVKTGYDKIITALGSDKAPQPAKPMAPPLERPGQTVYSGATGAALN